MSGFIDFTDGNIFDAASADTMMRQTIMRFPDTATLSAQLGGSIRAVGMRAWADSTGIEYQWNGTVWLPKESDWTTYSAAFTGNGVNITVGNSTVVSRWRYSGGQVVVVFKFTVGTTADMKTGGYAWGLPKTIDSTESLYTCLGYGQQYDVSASAWYPRFMVNNSSTSLIGVDMANNRMGVASPVAVAAGDIYSFRLNYFCTTDQVS